MLITEALNELKVLDSRIIRAIDDAVFVSAAKSCEKKVNPYTTKEEFAEKAKADYQSIDDLIKRREIIKAGVVHSNAVTFVEVGKRKMTVAAAIEFKQSIIYLQNLLSQMKKGRNKAVSVMNDKNIDMENSIQRLIETAYGNKDGKVNADAYASIANPFKESNEYGLVDPLNIADKIEALEKEIEDFTSNVDSCLQISNCITSIEIEE